MKKYYPVHDRIAKGDLERLGLQSCDVTKPLSSMAMPGGRIKGTDKYIMAAPTGEKRPPLKGEWYLSGSPINAYRAYGDLTTSYYIAKLVVVRKVTVMVEV